MNIDHQFVIIPREDLPDFTVIDRNGETHVDCGSDWGTWNVKHVARMKETALEYVGAWLTAEKWHADKMAALQTRSDEIAAQFTSKQQLIDRIIELEAKVGDD